MSKIVWLFLMFEFIVELTSVAPDQLNIRCFNITVERNCKNKQDSIFAPSAATALFKNLHCRNITNHGERRTDSLQCSCGENETFVAQNRTCVKNGFLVKMNSECKHFA